MFGGNQADMSRARTLVHAQWIENGMESSPKLPLAFRGSSNRIYHLLIYRLLIHQDINNNNNNWK